MKIISVSLRNFASYKSLDFTFDDNGMALIHGPTGAGKSTLCDAIPWVLFGRTAKDGAVDEVRSWDSEAPTYGQITVLLGKETIEVVRVRGDKHSDLSFTSAGSIKRGKDTQDTQRLINQTLGINSELYLAAAYFHEFSQTAQFFTTTAKNRRLICEQLVDLSLPKKLQIKAAEQSKALDRSMTAIRANRVGVEQSLTQLRRIASLEEFKAADWKRGKNERLQKLKEKHDNFETEKQQAITTYIGAEKAFAKEALKDPTCSECGSLLKTGKKRTPYNPFTAKIQAAKDRENAYLEQIDATEKETNPHHKALSEYTEAIDQLALDLEQLILKQGELISEFSDVELLISVVSSYRAHLIDGTIEMVQHQTNELLSSHFDAEVRIELTTKEADKIEIDVTKDGNLCSYTQLSKGQRQILKLCFAVAVMKTISEKHGVTFSQVFFDEALDGLDDNMKLKALGLLQKLQTKYEQIFVVEHNEALKAMISNQYRVTLSNGDSTIEKS